MSQGIVEIPIEVWKHCQQDAERMAYLHKECIKLKTENERLYKAGNDLYSLIIVLDYCLGNPEKNNPVRQEWLNIKKGMETK